MGIRGELFTKQINVENRTYFFNVKENRMGDVFLQIVESKNVDGVGFDRHAIVVFEEEMQTFLQGLNESLDFVEKNRKERAKEKRYKRNAAEETAAAGDKRIIRKKSTAVNGSSGKSGKKTPRKVHIVKKEHEAL